MISTVCFYPISNLGHWISYEARFKKTKKDEIAYRFEARSTLSKQTKPNTPHSSPQNLLDKYTTIADILHPRLVDSETL